MGTVSVYLDNTLSAAFYSKCVSENVKVSIKIAQLIRKELGIAEPITTTKETKPK